MTGAQFEIRIDGTPAVTATERTTRWRPRDSSRASMVEVKDLKSGDVTAVALRPG